MLVGGPKIASIGLQVRKWINTTVKSTYQGSIHMVCTIAVVVVVVAAVPVAEVVKLVVVGWGGSGTIDSSSNFCSSGGS